ncbi:hypothetical protein [Gaetbulibacter jejuensis]|uniref:WD40 repeat protein n=1 Tax=Gaetbulibacter jejuensis TaxID=584607 RepID=A0ABP3V3K8_9FLAO
MKQITLSIIFLYSLFSFSQSSTEDVIEPFLEDIVSQFPNVRDLAISPNGKEAVFSAQSFMGDISALMIVSKTDTKWSNPEVISFSGQYFDIEPFFSSDGLKLFFASNRPMNNTSTTVKDFDIWYVERSSTEASWSAPINLGAPVNTEMDEFYPVVTNSNNLYFTLDNPSLKRKDDIYISEFKNGAYTQPKPLSDSINSEGYEFNAFIAPDESFIIYTCYNRDDGYGSGDLYVSYKQENGEWSISKNMGQKVNSNKMEYCPFVDTQNGILYFTSKRLKTTSFKEKQSIEDLKTTFYSYENGLSRLYKISITNLIEK